MSPPARPRILMTTDAVGGVWVYAAEVARALCASGCELMLVILGPPPRPQQISTLRGIPGLDFRIVGLALEWMDPDGRDVEPAREQLLRVAEEFRPDVVHLNSFREGSFAWPAPVLIVAHSCVYTWWRGCRGNLPNEPRWRTYASNVATALSAADAWVAPTDAFRTAINATYKPLNKGRVIWNGLTVPPAVVTDKQPFVLAAGRFWDEAKNLAALGAIAAALPWPVHVAGPTQAPDGSRVQAANGGIKFLGELSRAELIAEMRRASVFVSPALYEPFGLTVLEAATCGCALALSDLRSFRELWNCALFFDPRDEASMRGALEALCSDRMLRNRLQMAARAHAQRYSRSAMTSAYRQLYGELRKQTDVAVAAHDPSV